MHRADWPAADRAGDTRCSGQPTGSSLVSPKIPKSMPPAQPARGFLAAASASFSPAAFHLHAFAPAPLVLDPPPGYPSTTNHDQNATAQARLIEPHAPIERSVAESGFRRDAGRRL